MRRGGCRHIAHGCIQPQANTLCPESFLHVSILSVRTVIVGTLATTSHKAIFYYKASFLTKNLHNIKSKANGVYQKYLFYVVCVVAGVEHSYRCK